MEYKNCCFVGHRKIEVTNELKQNLRSIIESMITEYNVNNFLFGTRSEFNDLCLEIVTDLKKNTVLYQE